VGAQALIEHLQLVIAKMQREKFGPHSEKSQRLIEQMELQLEELAAASAEDEAKTEAAARVEVQGFSRRKATRRNFPADLPRRRVVHPAQRCANEGSPTVAAQCGGSLIGAPSASKKLVRGARARTTSARFCSALEARTRPV
jgi:transposase